MKKRSYKLYVQDILDSMDKIDSYAKDLSFAEFSKNKMVVDAVLRNLEIIGEAVKNISPKIETEHKEIPWKEIIGMRNKITHEYFGVDLDIVWRTIKESLPSLRKSIRDIAQ